MGWQDDLDALARERGSALVAYAYLLTGDRPTAQDLVQDAFVRTFVRLGAGHDAQRLESYVRRAILNGVRDRFRRHSTFLGARSRLVEPLSADPDQTAVDKVDVERALERLTPRERACVVLRHYEDLPTAEIAEQLGLSQGAVRRYLSDAHARLGALLGDGPSEEHGRTEPVRLTARRTR